MTWSSQQLIQEAVAINHKQVAAKTRAEYARCLGHFSDYLASVHNVTFYAAQRRHVLLYLAHLEEPGAPIDPDATPCEWCRQRGLPNARARRGFAPSTRKKHLCAIGFLYRHFYYEDDLPDLDPSAHVDSPKCPTTQQYIPSEDEVARLLKAPGSPAARLLAHWCYFAPSRRATFVDVRWPELDLNAGTWAFVGKGQKPDILHLHPVLVRELRVYREWQRREAARNPKVELALSDRDTAYVLLTRNGKKTAGSTVLRMLKWHAIRANVAVVKANSVWDSPGGKTSRLNAHSLRRAWATHALDDGVPLHVVQEVLGHADISTTRRHYARTKSGRASEALVNMKVPKSSPD